MAADEVHTYGKAGVRTLVRSGSGDDGFEPKRSAVLRDGRDHHGKALPPLSPSLRNAIAAGQKPVKAACSMFKPTNTVSRSQ